MDPVPYHMNTDSKHRTLFHINLIPDLSLIPLQVQRAESARGSLLRGLLAGAQRLAAGPPPAAQAAHAPAAQRAAGQAGRSGRRHSTPPLQQRRYGRRQPEGRGRQRRRRLRFWVRFAGGRHDGRGGECCFPGTPAGGGNSSGINLGYYYL
jgi:hypothetical protein